MKLHDQVLICPTGSGLLYLGIAHAFGPPYAAVNLQSTVLLLSNRAAVIGPIDASNAEVEHSVAEKKGITAGATLVQFLFFFRWG